MNFQNLPRWISTNERHGGVTVYIANKQLYRSNWRTTACIQFVSRLQWK